MALRLLIRRVFHNNAVAVTHKKCIRTLLSQAYACNKVWSERLQTPLLQNIDVSNYAIEIQDQIDRDGSVTAIDMDILANKLEKIDSHQLDFVQNILYRFRHSLETVKTRESMNHAICRALLKFGETDRLLNILADKVNYGLFLDDYSANIVLDHFIENQMYKEAVQIAVDQMLQENFIHPVTRYLSWYACHLRIKSTAVSEMEVETEAEVPERNDEEEETLIKVKFIKLPWYDDHWDLDRESLRIGKTLAMITEGEENLLGRSYHLLGLALWNKFSEALEFLESVGKDSEATISKDAMDMLHSELERVETQEPSEEKKEPGLIQMKDVKPYITQQQKEEYLSQLQALKSQLENEKIVDKDLEEELVEKMKSVIKVIEPRDIEDQTTLYRSWAEERQQLLDNQVKEYKETQRRREIADRLKELQEKEEKLRFFERRNKIKVAQSQAPKEISIEEFVEQEVFVAPPGERGRKN